MIISGGALKVDDVKVVVLDEADEILSRGFKEHVHNGMHYGMYVCIFIEFMYCMYVLYVCAEVCQLVS